MRYTIVFTMAIGIIMAATFHPSRSIAQPLAGEIGIEIVSDGQRSLRSIPAKDFYDRGTRIIKKYLEAVKGENYSLVIRNNTPERIGLVIAVDGRNIISGKRSDLASRENMYLLNPHEHAQYDGWRTSDREVHRFYFTTPPDSYSIKTFGDASALGVIAVAVYREKEKPRCRLEEEMKKESATPAPSSKGAVRGLADESAGTGFGDARYSPVIKVEFEPEAVPVQKTLVKYEWRETLCRKGILRCGQQPQNRLWDEGYAPFPPGYAGR